MVGRFRRVVRHGRVVGCGVRDESEFRREEAEKKIREILKTKNPIGPLRGRTKNIIILWSVLKHHRRRTRVGK